MKTSYSFYTRRVLRHILKTNATRGNIELSTDTTISMTQAETIDLGGRDHIRPVPRHGDQIDTHRQNLSLI